MMFKYFFVALGSFCFWINLATAQVLCFKSESIRGKSTKLQLTLPDDGSKNGKIKYEHGVDEIVIEREGENTISEKKGFPAVVRTYFAEIIDGKRVGIYSLTTQGGIVGELSYKKIGKRKVYKFYDDQDSSRNDSCDWSDPQSQVP